MLLVELCPPTQHINKNSYVEVLTPVSQNVTLIRDRVVTEVLKLKSSLGWV